MSSTENNNKSAEIPYSEIPEVSPTDFKQLLNKNNPSELEYLIIKKFKFQIAFFNSIFLDEEKLWKQKRLLII